MAAEGVATQRERTININMFTQLSCDIQVSASDMYTDGTNEVRLWATG